MTATLVQQTTDLATPARIRITGAEARDIAQHVRAYVRPGRDWSEVQVMRKCGYGCKLYVRRQGAVTRYALIHSCAYGCPLGHDPATREVPVSVAPKAVAVPVVAEVAAGNSSAKWAALFPHERPLMWEARRDLVEIGYEEDLVAAMSVAEVKRFAGGF
jgi:hypothetical protein